MIRTNSQTWMHFSIACFVAFALTMSGCGTDDMNLRSLGLGKKSSRAGVDAAALAGNGAPSGKHFSLNLIGVPKNKTATITSGNRIFLPLEGTAKVNLSQGDFMVLDANGTDGVAAFRLPAPDADGDGVTSYSVYARALGKPNGSIKANTCATDVVSGELVCSLETLVQIRTKGKSSFSNVSRELLSISADIDGDGTVERVPLFDSRLQDYFWGFDNQGLKLLQLRFVEVPTAF
ncbi:MAG TPA: hypothetical protein VFO10_31090 [Oligoflexus sp.]|uniref:hypothetical protein n=1 Tax=Oligoflexus sp. TaxID=1971216 RepID=UPI002D7E23AF|nr:hypothetical protein [Oligoflexus sp.]HET9241755.1 hypothetical protein [Oligoflexus sp.]